MNADKSVQELQRRINKFRADLVYNLGRRISKSAQNNFNRFEKEASTDNFYVYVAPPIMSSSGHTTSAEVGCYGEQVIFLEFGVGTYFKSMAYRDYKITYNDDFSIKDMKAIVVEKGGRGFDKYGGTETMPRPAGVDQLGFYHNAVYGISQGTLDFWVRPSDTGYVNANIDERYVTDRRGNVRSNAVWTHGHQPARALWRAVMSALRSVFRG